MTPRGHKVNASSVGDNETAIFNESSTATTTIKKGIENSKFRQSLFTNIFIYGRWYRSVTLENDYLIENENVGKSCWIHCRHPGPCTWCGPGGVCGYPGYPFKAVIEHSHTCDGKIRVPNNRSLICLNKSKLLKF